MRSTLINIAKKYFNQIKLRAQAIDNRTIGDIVHTNINLSIMAKLNTKSMIILRLILEIKDNHNIPSIIVTIILKGTIHRNII
jgi:hypothetical protein